MLHKLSNLFSWHDSNHKNRIFFLISIFVIGFAIISIRVMMLSLKDSANSNSFTSVKVDRKEILDASGQIIAVTIPSVSLFANPQHVIDATLTLKSLSKAIKNLDTKKLLKDLSSDKTFVWIKHEVSPFEKQMVNSLGLPGLYFEEQPKRFYIYGPLFSHILGFVSRDNRGIAGIEKFLDKDIITTSVGGGKDSSVMLSLDLRAQTIANEELDTTIAEFNALGGVVIIADVTNGEVIASVSKPDFNPNDVSKAKADNLFNRASLGVYELGSIIKGLVLSVGFDTGQITLSDLYDLDNNVLAAGKKDYHKRTGWNSVAEIFMHSSNIGLGQIALEVGKNNIKDYWEALGLFSTLQIETAERAAPIYLPYKKWRDLNLITMSFGYNLAISPLHFVQAMIPVVNGGYYYPLTLLKRASVSPVKARQIFNTETSVIMNKLLRLNVSQGTGKKANVAGQLVGGKTGTAEKLIDRHYSKNHRYSSFVASFPSISPKYIVFVMLDDPKGTKETFGFATAGFTCAPMVGRIISRLAAAYAMPSFNEEDPDIQKALTIDYQLEGKKH